VATLTRKDRHHKHHRNAKMKHHIMKEEELKSRCIYCSAKIELKKWKSEFENFFHYKSAVCDRCHHRNRIRVKFSGSGEDAWAEGLEKKVIEG